MARILIDLPAVLGHLREGPEGIELQAGPTLAAAFERLRQDRPRLALHLLDESGALRPHVLCFLNGRNTRWLESLDVPLEDGDRLTVMQAVSGG